MMFDQGRDYLLRMEAKLLNLRIVTFVSSEEEDVVKELVADFAEALIARGFSNDVENTDSSLKSLIAVKENLEILGGAPEVFFQEQLENALMTVIPTDSTNKTEEKENPEDDAA
jgi:hypothetical protein